MFHNNGICGGCALVLVDVDDGLGIMGIACGFGGATAKVGPAFCHWLKSRWKKLRPEAKPGGNMNINAADYIYQTQLVPSVG